MLLQRRENRLLSRRETFWLTGAGIALIATSYGLARFSYGLFVPVFQQEFGLDAATTGAIASGSYLSYCIAIVVSTLVTPRYGGRSIALAAGSIAAVGTLLIGIAPNAVLLAIGVLSAGASTGLASPPLAHAVAHTVQPPIRSRTQTIINAGTGLGLAVAAPIALLALDHWRAAWIAFAIVSAATTIWVLRSVPTGPAYGQRSGTWASLVPKPLFPQGSGRLLLAAGMMGLASTAIWTFGPDLLVSSGGLSETTSTLTWVFLGAFGMLGAAAGDFGQKFGLRQSWHAFMLLMAIGTAGFALFPGSVSIAWIAAAGFGIAYIGLTGLLLIWGTNVYSYSPASGVGLTFLAIAVGQAIGSPLIGIVSELSTSRLAFLLAAVIAAITAFLRPLSARRARAPHATPKRVQDIA